MCSGFRPPLRRRATRSRSKRPNPGQTRLGQLEDTPFRKPSSANLMSRPNARSAKTENQRASKCQQRRLLAQHGARLTPSSRTIPRNIAKGSGGPMLFHRISKTRTCPKCHSADAYRVRRTGIPVKVVCKLLNVRPHRCPDCDTFFLGPRSSREQRRIEPSMPEPRTPKTGGGAQPQAGNA
jgi:hypothetical protein